MKRTVFALLLAVGVPCVAPPRAAAQDWQPPSRSMPAMPRAADLAGSWRSATGAWGGSLQRMSGVPLAEIRAAAEATDRKDPPTFVRFTGAARPVAAWSDRNGDGTADLVELFRGGAKAAEVIDADFDGRADAVRHFDRSGKLLRTDTY